MTLTIDVAKPADVATIRVLIGELAEFERLAHEVVATESGLHEALFGPRPAAETVLARVDAEVAGFALFYHNFSTFIGRHGLYIEDLYVRPAFRGQGVGRTLLAHLARLATARGCGRMEWSVLNWNRRAIGFYEALGAKPVNDWTIYRLDRAGFEAIQPGAAGE
ncbi:MAG TPA: GNAT family N-acetyltransferase [Steroidobacteraceae bacterium]|nr:GNAT family N-acetyltransferase [Steroidobacteraceae bacterium]